MTKMAKTWWGKRFLHAMESFSDPGRLARGRQYLSSHRVIQWNVEGNRVDAKVRGKTNPYYGVYEPPVYDTRLVFKEIPEDSWRDTIRLIGSRAGFISRLLFNEIPDEIEQFLQQTGVGLLPTGPDQIQCQCSCPDPERPCKHLAALYYLLAGRLDQDPFLLFELRGLSREELIGQLRATRLGLALATELDERPPSPSPAASFFTRPEATSLPASICPRRFWKGQRRPPSAVELPPPPGVSGILVRKGGDHPTFWEKDDSFVEVMDAFYQQVRKKGKEWL